jgi:[protein-PII] uridylyltransferase
MKSESESIRAFLSAKHHEIAAAHKAGASGLTTCCALTAAMDEAVRSAFNSLSSLASFTTAQDHIAILALGGYGRAELCPNSDIDVMVLCDSGKFRQAAREVATTFLHVLWDAGVNIGHSVRTIEEALEMHSEDLDAWTSMIESRPLCGSQRLVQTLVDEMRSRISVRDNLWFVEGVLAARDARHERYGNSVKLLEPNIKKSAGGFRDIHAVFWLHRGTDPAYFTSIDPAAPASAAFFASLASNGVLDTDEFAVASAAMQFLFRTRHEMHFRRASLHDELEYALQLDVAEGLGFGPRAELRSVEVFMRDYYLHARAIHRMNQRLSRPFRELIEPLRIRPRKGEPIGTMFLLHENVLSLHPDTSLTRFSDPAHVLEAFVYAAEHEAVLDFRLSGAIERSTDLFTARQQDSPELAALLRRILQSRRVARTLHEMNELGVLGKFIPEFGALVAFFQHNVYHYFTADEHTLIAIANAEDLRERQGILHDVFRNLRRKDLLYLAILLHDIAKPHGVGDHEITGVPMAENILRRLGMDEIIPQVTFLVRHHLIMEQIAFRRNIHDPVTIREFAALFERPENLDYLYILTYADLSAVNINVWTEWKAALLEDLYRRTSEVLRRNLRGVQIEEFHQARRTAAEAAIVDTLSASFPREEVQRHLRGMQSDSYISLFTEEEISEHMRRMGLEGVSVIFNHSEGHTEVTVIAPDAPFALSKFCAVLAANDANIFDANIFTRDDSIIIDRFRVSDATTRQQLDQQVCGKIAEDMKQVMEGTLDVEHLFQTHRRKWKRRMKHPVNPNIRTDVEFEDNPNYTIIDVYAPDAVGLLYRITETISRLGLDIYFAKIATRVDGVVDAFYTLNRTGNVIVDPEQREGIKAEILATIGTMSEQELA